MASPVLDEDQILMAIQIPLNEDNLLPVRMGTLCSVIDAFDRKLLRDPYVELVGDAMNLHSCSGRLEILYGVRQLFKDGKFEEKFITDSIEHIEKRGDTFRASLVAKMRKVAECRNDTDPVH